jgi:hypothetical protein
VTHPPSSNPRQSQQGRINRNMNRVKYMWLTAITLVAGLLLWSLASKAQPMWIDIDEGLDKTTIQGIEVFRIDQSIYEFNVKGSNTRSKILPDWVGEDKGGVNLNMFVVGYLPEGYTKIEGRVIQPDFHSKYNAFIVWNENELKIMDRQLDSIDEILTWPNVSQNIRMIWRKDEQRNRWSKSHQMWSVATIATSSTGDVYFIHCRKPYTMNEYTQILIDVLDIEMMAYLEGGPESSIVINAGENSYEMMGSYETDFNENDENKVFWPLPWVLTFEKR